MSKSLKEQFDEAMAYANERLGKENKITERVYDVIEEATNEGNFLEEDRLSIALNKDKYTNKKTIAILIGADVEEYEITIKRVFQD